MFPLDYALALALITSPGDAVPLPEGCPLECLRAVAEGMELMDPRERLYLFATAGDAHDDLRLVRARHRELRDAPRIDDALRWPSADFCRDMLSANRAYAIWLNGHRAVDRGEWIDAALEDAAELYRVWDVMSDINSQWYCLTARRQKLRELREMIGAERYYAGLYPPAVPVWRLKRID